MILIEYIKIVSLLMMSRLQYLSPSSQNLPTKEKSNSQKVRKYNYIPSKKVGRQK